MSRNNRYYYEASVNRNGMAVLRQGVVPADTEMDALDRIYRMAKEDWKRTIMKCRVWRIKDGGATSPSPDVISENGPGYRQVQMGEWRGKLRDKQTEETTEEEPKSQSVKYKKEPNPWIYCTSISRPIIKSYPQEDIS